MRNLCILFIYLSLCTLLRAQQAEVYSFDIQTVRAVANNKSGTFPIISLSSGEYIDVSFDQLSHEYKRYTYRVSHHNADWSESGLSSLEYLEGFEENLIEDYENSSATTVPYTHYKFRIPNEYLSIKASGNYIITVYDDYEREIAFKTFFRVLDKKVLVSSRVSSDTDIDRNKTHQQLSLSVNYSGYPIRNPQQEVTIQVMQNRRTDNMVTNIVPSYINGNELRYEHNKKLIFPAGNEYRRFEFVTNRYTTSGVESIVYESSGYQVLLYPSESRNHNYIYDEDQNGRFVVRSIEANNQDTEADYYRVHFALPWSEKLKDGDLYLLGEFNYNNLNGNSKLLYDAQEQMYYTSLLLKQGAYNYMYLYVPKGKSTGITDLIEGNYYQTENEYTVLVYHRAFGERYDKLVGGLF